ncbi:ADP-ribosylglycohydrolase family protein [Nitrosomonas sp. ANs5]|uniref:ADP-ribosylglycohydrolase family protein n=1 Tax=Nitrosomonas sp. ANs5 TaxID=3423941 RepID=UPI003D3309AA
MQTNIQIESRAATVMGALVADAASLGLHWLYDPERIAQIEKTAGLVFLQPEANHYAGAKGYFAHGNKQAGDSSGYGETCLLALKHFAQYREFDRRAYQQQFSLYFGPGGQYVGYVDTPTRQTLRVLLAEKSDTFPEKSGADDDQLIALSTIPVLAAAHQGSMDKLLALVDTVVRITNNNAVAVAAARCVASVLFCLQTGMPMREALEQAVPHAGGALSDLLAQAIARRHENSLAIASEFGSACHVMEGLPIVFHIASRETDYRAAVQENIRIGGDSCGRSIALGAIMAAHWSGQKSQSNGIPLAWIARYRNLQMAVDALAAINGDSADCPEAVRE